MRNVSDYLKIARRMISFSSMVRALGALNPFSMVKSKEPEPAQVPKRTGKWSKVDKAYHAKRKARNKRAAESRRVNWRKAA